MSDFTDFIAQIKEWQNREDWSDNLATSFVRMAEQKMNAELRVSRMIQSTDGLIASRCAPLPDDWLEFSLVRIASAVVPTGFIPIRYKARDEFFNLPDQYSLNYYTIEGRQIFFGGTPDSVNGQTVRLSYYGEVPVFADDQDSLDLHQVPESLPLGGVDVCVHARRWRRDASRARQATC